MAEKYQHILSPVPIGTRGKVLRNRLYLAKCDIREDTDFFLRSAKSGASLVMMNIDAYKGREQGDIGYGGRFKLDNMFDPAVREHYSRQNDELHALGTLSCASMMMIEPSDVGISDVPNWRDIPRNGDYKADIDWNQPGISLERLERLIDEFVFRAVDVYKLGFDMVCFYMSYRGSILANSLSPCYNQRKDRYGGTTNKERATLCTEIFSKIKQACPDMLIGVQISGVEEPPGYTVEDWLEYCRCWEGLVDLYEVRDYDGSSTHVNGYNMRPHQPPALRFSEAFKKAGIRGLVAPIGGLGNPDDIERFLAEGKMDLAALARQFIAEPEYLPKLIEDRAADIVPCTLCNRCHGKHRCTVNPVLLTRAYTYDPPTRAKKLAVIGGGIAGMQAAITAAKRGHTVHLYEKSDRLGGQLRFADTFQQKWPVKNYRDWAIEQLKKSGASIHLSTEATPEMLREGAFDAVICAIGSHAVIPPVSGASAPYVWKAEDIYGHEEELGHRVTVIGGGITGRETAVHLAYCGHETTLVCHGQAVLFEDPHSQYAVEHAALDNPNFHYLEHARTLEIGPNHIVCQVKRGIPPIKLGFSGYMMPGYIIPVEGESRVTAPPYDETNAYIEPLTLEHDSVVISAGRFSPNDIVESFRAVAPEFYAVGDCSGPGDIKKCNTEAYDAAMRL